MKNSELETQLAAMKQDLKFKVQLLETELEEERKRNKVDFNSIHGQLKSDYEARLRAEMESLRRVYEEQTEKAKMEYMHLHSRQLKEAQEQLSHERSTGMASKMEMEDWRARMEKARATINQLEADKAMIHKQLKQQGVL